MQPQSRYVSAVFRVLVARAKICSCGKLHKNIARGKQPRKPDFMLCSDEYSYFLEYIVSILGLLGVYFGIAEQQKQYQYKAVSGVERFHRNSEKKITKCFNY